jgi:hypothetical protein
LRTRLRGNLPPIAQAVPKLTEFTSVRQIVRCSETQPFCYTSKLLRRVVFSETGSMEKVAAVL